MSTRNSRPNRARQRAARAAQAEAQRTGRDTTYTRHLRPGGPPVPLGAPSKPHDLTRAASSLLSEDGRRAEATARFTSYRRAQFDDPERELVQAVIEPADALVVRQEGRTAQSLEDNAAAYHLLGLALAHLRLITSSQRLIYLDGWINPHRHVRIDWRGTVTLEEVLDQLVPHQAADGELYGIAGLQLDWYDPSPGGQASLVWFPSPGAATVTLGLSCEVVTGLS